MSGARTVAYGFSHHIELSRQGLIVAWGLSLYFVKDKSYGRRKETLLKKSRPSETITYEEKLARTQAASQKSTDGSSIDPKSSSSLHTTFPGGGMSSAMQSQPTGVDTPRDKAAGSDAQHRR